MDCGESVNTCEAKRVSIRQEVRDAVDKIGKFDTKHKFECGYRKKHVPQGYVYKFLVPGFYEDEIKVSVFSGSLKVEAQQSPDSTRPDIFITEKLSHNITLDNVNDEVKKVFLKNGVLYVEIEIPSERKIQEIFFEIET